MKRITCLLLTLVFAFTFSTGAFAAGEDTVDEANPAAAPENVHNEIYGEDEFDVPDEPIPEDGSVSQDN